MFLMDEVLGPTRATTARSFPQKCFFVVYVVQPHTWWGLFWLSMPTTFLVYLA